MVGWRGVTKDGLMDGEMEGGMREGEVYRS